MPPLTHARLKNTCRLIPSRFPSTGLLDSVASPDDLLAVLQLKQWTDDRISSELGILHRIPKEEWVTGEPFSHVIMSAFTHPRPHGCRFNGPDRGAWYAGIDLGTAHAEAIYHKTLELAEIGVTESAVRMQLYLADFHADFHDIRAQTPEHERYHDPDTYGASQALGRELFAQGSNGILYRSQGRVGGECLSCFRPKLITNVRAGRHFEYRWAGSLKAKIREL